MPRQEWQYCFKNENHSKTVKVDGLKKSQAFQV